ncbi:hypothetical protein Goshw_009676, partial [Gossypium schwendimanii]|nr:hypothetical protein [Gossypium schwendimanii]
FKKVLVECDNILVVQLLNDRIVWSSSLALIRNISDLYGQEWKVKLSYINREANQVVDCFAKCMKTFEHVFDPA